MSDPAFDACVVSMEVDGRQNYIFETDKLQEILGASRIIARTVDLAEEFFRQEDGLFLFSPVSGEIRVWSRLEKREALLSAAWELAREMDRMGLRHSACYMETYSNHFEKPSDPGCDVSFGDYDPDPGPDHPSLAWVHRALGSLIRVKKDAGTAEDATPRCSLFAVCRMHPTDAATHWLSEDSGDEGENEDNDPRRLLTGWRARKKRYFWKSERRQIYHDLVQAVWESGLVQDCDTFEYYEKRTLAEISRQFARFISSSSDLYIGYACGDGDGMGDLLTSLDWNDGIRWGTDDARQPWMRNREFVKAYDALIKSAYRKSVSEELVRLTGSHAGTPAKLAEDLYSKILPQLLGGDDIWIVGARQTIAMICDGFMKNYETMATRQPEFTILRKAVEVAESIRKHRGKTATVTPLAFTVSMGISYSKAAYPVSETIRYAESLMKGAKVLRKGGAFSNRMSNDSKPADMPTGCIDWHWVESSLPEDVGSARALGLSYVDTDSSIVHLTTRPWKRSEYSMMREAAILFQEIPRGKRENLEYMLRRGKILGDIAWMGWINHLSSDQRKTLEDVVEKLPKAMRMKDPYTSPWIETGAGTRATPFLDLLAFQHVFGVEGAYVPDEITPASPRKVESSGGRE